MPSFNNITKACNTLIIVFICVSILSLFENPSLISIGRLSIDVLLIMSLIFVTFYLFNEKLNFQYHFQIACLFILLSVFYTYGYYLFRTDTTIQPIIELILFFIFIFSLILIKWNKRDLNIISSLVAFFVIMFFYQWVTLDYPLFKFESVFRNPNALGAVLLVFSYFIILRAIYGNHFTKGFNIILMLIVLFLIYCTTSRTVWLSISAILIAWIIYYFFREKFKYLFPLALGLNLLFSVFYVISFNTVLGDFLDNWSRTLFGKGLYSGRHTLWNELFNHALNSPFLGYGYGTNFTEMNSKGQSPHNMYLQIMLESGAIGLITFILVLYFIWKMLLNNIETIAAKLSAFYLIGLLVYLNFETTIFPSTIVAIGIFQWLIITFGISFKEQNLSNRYRS